MMDQSRRALQLTVTLAMLVVKAVAVTVLINWHRLWLLVVFVYMIAELRMSCNALHVTIFKILRLCGFRMSRRNIPK